MTSQHTARTAVRLVCSPNPRASTQKGAKGNQWWKREPFHIDGRNFKTLCGRNSSGWLALDIRPSAEALSDQNCCQRCARAKSGSDQS